MQCLVMFADIIRTMDIDVEILIFLCSLVLYLILQFSRNAHNKKKQSRGPGPGVSTFVQSPGRLASADSPVEFDESARSARYAQLDKSFHEAFESEDYWEVLKCWNALKKFKQCPSIHLTQVVKAMQCCNKHPQFIVAELRDYFKAHPKERSIGLINNMLEPLARRQNDSQLIDMIARMLPNINIAKNSRTYEILLTMAVAKQDVAKAQDVMAEMREAGVAFTPCSTVAVLTMALQSNNADLVLRAFSKLKDSWNVRSTWAVSPFALEQHKTHTLTQVVQVACRKGKLLELLPLLASMKIPKEVQELVKAECGALSDLQLATMFKLLAKSVRTKDADSLCSMLGDCLDPRSKAWLCTAMQSSHEQAISDASTSEGSRSDSESGE